MVQFPCDFHVFKVVITRHERTQKIAESQIQTEILLTLKIVVIKG
jgi:hypothetical protein